ncbi:MAG: 30S ribosomal protein S16, partial [Jatrophihabitantaceae bacterium]
AQPTEAVAAILKVTGDWQKFKGLPEPPPMLVAPPKPDKRALFDAALKDSEGEPTVDATTPKKRAAKKTAAEPAEAPAAEASPEAPAADAAPTTGADS